MSEAITERMKVLANIHITGTLPTSDRNKKIAAELASLGFINRQTKKCLTKLTKTGFQAIENHIKSKQTSV